MVTTCERKLKLIEKNNVHQSIALSLFFSKQTKRPLQDTKDPFFFILELICRPVMPKLMRKGQNSVSKIIRN